MPDPAAAPPTPPVPLAALLAREDLGLRQIAGPRDPATVDPLGAHLGDGRPVPVSARRRAAAHGRGAHPGGGGLGHLLRRLRLPDRRGGRRGPRLRGGPGARHGPARPGRGLRRLRAAAAGGPAPTTFSGVARAVWQLMAQARHTELRRVTEAQQSLAAAAARPDPVPSVLRQLARRVGGRAVLYAPDGGEVASAGAEPADGGGGRALAGLATVVRPGQPGPYRRPPTAAPRPAPSSATDTVAGTHLAAYALGTGQGFVLGLCAPRAATPATTRSPPSPPSCSPSSPGEHQSGTGAARSVGPRTAAAGCRAGGGRAAARRRERWVVVHARRRARRRTPSPRPRWGRRSARRWSTWTATSYGSSCPRPPREPPPSRAGPAASAPPSAPHEWAPPTPRRPAPCPAPGPPARRWSATAITRVSPAWSRRPRPPPTPGCASLPSPEPRPHGDPPHLALPARQLGPYGGRPLRPPQHGPPAHRPLRDPAGRRTWTIRTYAWSCGSRCAGSEARRTTRRVMCATLRGPHGHPRELPGNLS